MAMTTSLTSTHQRPRSCIHVQRDKDNMTCCELRGGGENQRVMLHDKT